ncbi:MAG: protein phosphatase 2C domain-containing protein [Firmicutes bacterium]|nr:protein phosphatase 2C domain-containing protein [Bacillota bacterium]
MRAIAVSKQGKVRTNNEDSIYINEESGFFAIADGMGGHEAGEVASNMAIEKIRIELEDLENIQVSTIELAFNATNKMIYEQSSYKDQRTNMGTTLSILKIIDDRGYIGHIGDSRIYLIRNQEIIKLTEDHTYVERLYQDGIITYDEYLNHPKKNILLKALGSDKPADPQVLEFQILPGDIIFLCTDGVHYYMKNEELIYLLLKKSGKKLIKELSDIIDSRGANDNYSFIVIDKF